MLTELAKSIAAHTGTFHCVEINRESNTKTVEFSHVSSPADSDVPVPPVPGFKDFYATFGSLTMYVDELSGEAAYHIAGPNEWSELDAAFRPWLDGVDEEEYEEYVPLWVKDCIVVGEFPRTGNYLLIPTGGPETGAVYEFEHDGFEFNELAKSLPEFVASALDLDNSRLLGIASHLRFITEGSNSQWWITELRDNRGNLARTEP